jgi:hypothetical protein
VLTNDNQFSTGNATATSVVEVFRGNDVTTLTSPLPILSFADQACPNNPVTSCVLAPASAFTPGSRYFSR